MGSLAFSQLVGLQLLDEKYRKHQSGLSFADTGSTDSEADSTDGNDVGDSDGSVDANASDDQLDTTDATD